MYFSEKGNSFGTYPQTKICFHILVHTSYAVFVFRHTHLHTIGCIGSKIEFTVTFQDTLKCFPHKSGIERLTLRLADKLYDAIKVILPIEFTFVLNEKVPCVDNYWFIGHVLNIALW